MGIAGIAVAIVGGLLGLVAVGGIVLYATDYKVDATITETRCDLLEVAVKTRQFGIDHTVTGVSPEQCGALTPGDRVEYRIRTQRTTLYNAEGDCMYDSKTGPGCGQSPAGPGGILRVA